MLTKGKWPNKQPITPFAVLCVKSVEHRSRYRGENDRTIVLVADECRF
jgi:hypothetical protein